MTMQNFTTQPDALNASTAPAPAPAKSDATQRAVRTLVQGAAVTALSAVATVVADATLAPDTVFTAHSWVIIGGTAAVAVLHSVASYVMAKVVPAK